MKLHESMLLTLRCIVSISWCTIIAIWSDSAVWFMSGTLGLTHFTTGCLLMLAGVRYPYVRQANLIILISDLLGLVPLSLYLANLFSVYKLQVVDNACVIAFGTSAVRMLICDMWHTAPALIVAAFVLIGTTIILHITTIIMAIVNLKQIPRIDS